MSEPITREQLLIILTEMASTRIDQEAGHVIADEALLLYINDDEIREAYEAIQKWYA